MLNKKDKKVELIELMKKYVDEDNCIDISKFHNDNRGAYALLPHYFGSVNSAITENGWIKVTRPQYTKDSGMTLRDQLAYDMLELLRKGGKINRQTFEQIAGKYEVTKPAISQLHKALEKTASKAVKKESDNV